MLYVSGSVVVPVRVPEQLSDVVGAVAVAEHSPVTSAKVGVVGSVTSSTITFCGTMILLPLPSSKVQLMTKVPCVLYVSGSVVVPVKIPEQLSVVVGAVAVAEHSPVTS